MSKGVFGDAAPSTNYYKGGYSGLPDDTNTQVLFWNKADFKAAGVSGPSTTLAQLWQDDKLLTRALEGTVRPRHLQH